MHLLCPRGGGKHARPRPEATSDAAKRQTMNGWAEERIRDHVPMMDDRLVRTLLRSEGRITPAVLQAKSAIQVRHVVIAALKRAGLHDQAKTLLRAYLLQVVGMTSLMSIPLLRVRHQASSTLTQSSYG